MESDFSKIGWVLSFFLLSMTTKASGFNFDFKNNQPRGSSLSFDNFGFHFQEKNLFCSICTAYRSIPSSVFMHDAERLHSVSLSPGFESRGKTSLRQNDEMSLNGLSFLPRPC